jgi:hypothetical protein
MTYGSLYFGKDGFLYKKNGAVGNRRIFSLGLICNQPTDINNKYVSGSGVNGAVSSTNYAIRRKMIRNSANCVNNSCSINYFYLGVPLNGSPSVTPSNTTCSALLPQDTPYQVCSPFPFWGGLYSNNRRLSPFVGSQNGNQKWSKTIDYAPDTPYVFCSPIISKDGTIYITDTSNSYLYAISKEGIIKWGIDLSEYGISLLVNSVTIGKNNTIYINSNDFGIYAVIDNGSTVTFKGFAYSGYPISNTLIGNNDILYVVSYLPDGMGVEEGIYLVGVNQTTGSVVNYIELISLVTNTFGISISGLGIGSDGTIYAVSYYIDSEDSNYYYGLYAVNTDFTLKWSYIESGGATLSAFSNPSIATDGTIYFVASIFETAGEVIMYAINPDGSLKWTSLLSESGLSYSSPTIGNNGAIYICVANIDDDTTTLFSIKPSDGTIKWTHTVNYPTILSSCLIGADETVYFSTYYTIDAGIMYAVNTDSNGDPYTKWQKNLGQGSYSSPTMDSNGVVYTVTTSGILYAFNNSNPITTIPTAPRNVTATSGYDEAVITFTAPASDGGSTITSYTVTSSPDGVTATGSSSSITITGLTSGTAYTFTVIAINSVGYSPSSSASNSVTPSAPTVPTAPTITDAYESSGQVTLDFTAPTSDGGSTILTYTITSSPGSITNTISYPATSITITGLTNNTSYTFTLVATNSIGDSPAATSDPITPLPDGTLTDSFTTVGSTTWTAPSTTNSITYLIVGGGGGGGGAYDNAGAGGGGGGMVLSGTMSVTPGTTYTIVVGDGGAAGTADRTQTIKEYNGTDGDDSSFDTIVASGGGFGYKSRSAPGGSGVGGTQSTSSVASTGGNGGGGGSGGGGGGGAGSAGSSKSGTSGGAAGTGVSNSITGSAVTYGGAGKGGNSGSNNNGTASADNIGEGGDGAGSASSNNKDGRKGGSGVVIITYEY